MALVKPTPIDPIQRGRQAGTSFFRAGGRTIARQIVIPVDPANKLQTGRRSGIAAGSKTYAYELSTSEQAAWDATSKFDSRGELEISAAAVAANVASEPTPKIRSVGASPPFPGIFAMEYNAAIPRISMVVGVPAPITNFITTYKTNPPLPATRLPNKNELVIFRSKPAISGITQLLPDYITRFGPGFPPRTAIMIEVYNYNTSLPAQGLTTQVLRTEQAVTNGIQTLLAPATMSQLGSIILQIQPRFGSVSIGAPIPLTITAPDFSTTFAATVNNFAVTNGVLSDTLGSSRRASITLTLTASTTDIVSVQLFPTVTI